MPEATSPSTSLPRSVLLYGSETPLPEQIPLRAGPLTMIFEPDNVFLRYIRLGSREVVRGIYAAVRDRNWGTIAPRVSNLQIKATEDTFEVTFEVECREREINFVWQGRITGDARGTIRFSFDGLARSTFWRNRIGFCVLHPIRECAGYPCFVEKVDGEVEQGRFPRFIAPHQPFTDMRAITHEVAPGLAAEVRFEGDIFEMEDQRNWTDASFKTYCTPLRLPFPVGVAAGTKVVQAVTLALHGEVPTAPDRLEDSSIIIMVGEAPSVTLPQIGLGMASHGEPLSQQERERLKALNLMHLRVDLRLSEPDWRSTLSRACAAVKSTGLLLEAALFLSDAAEQELSALLRALQDEGRPFIDRWLVFHVAEKSTGEQWIKLARRYLPYDECEEEVGAGTNAYFAELNRACPPLRELKFVCYSVNPQVHAFDTASLVETLEMQGQTVESARQFCGNRPVVVSPVTLRPRFNPNATGPEPPPAPGELPSQVDVRQMSLFGAAWTLGSLKYLAQSGADSVTYYETTGWRGVMETEQGSPLPEKFRPIAGGVFPLYHVLADVGEFAGGQVRPCASSAPLQVDALVIEATERTRILLTNLSPTQQRVTLVYPGLSPRVQVKPLDETSVEQAMRSPEEFRSHPGHWQATLDGRLDLDLLPYAVVRIDSAS